MRYLLVLLLISIFCGGQELISEDRQPIIYEKDGGKFLLEEYNAVVTGRKQKAYTRLFRCKTCGRVFSEARVRQHSAEEGHWEFDRYGY